MAMIADRTQKGRQERHEICDRASIESALRRRKCCGTLILHLKREKSMACWAETAPAKRRCSIVSTVISKTDGGSFCLDVDGLRREVAAEDIGYVLSTPTVPEFLTGREFLKFFLDINEQSIRNPKSIDEYFDYDEHRAGGPGQAFEGLFPRHEEQDADAGEHHRAAKHPAVG